MNSILEFFSKLENGDKAGWLQAIGTVVAILASGWIAVWQANKQYKNSLRLQDIQDKNKEIILTESVVEIIKNSAARVKYVYDSLNTRQDVYDIAIKNKYYDFEGLIDVVESLKQIPLKDLPSPMLVTSVMTLISGIRQLEIQVDKAIANHSKMNASDYSVFFQTLLQIKNSTAKTHQDSEQYLKELKKKGQAIKNSLSVH